jgi:hypothetical protein
MRCRSRRASASCCRRTAIRKAAKDVLILADGFSCRTQIAERTDRRALHLADALEMAAADGPHGPSGEYPERPYVPSYDGPRPAHLAMAATAGLLGTATLGYVLATRRHPG